MLDPDCIGGICNASPSRLEVSGDLAAGLVSNNNTHFFLVRLDFICQVGRMPTVYPHSPDAHARTCVHAPQHHLPRLARSAVLATRSPQSAECTP